jgi:sulfur-carrier protein adenylyltransferase/sulfurtransferase
MRSVDRRPYRLGPLAADDKACLSEVLGPGLEITWYESPQARLGIAGLNAAATDIRLRIPETYPVHKQIIDWRRRQSPTGIPAQALGLDKSSLAIMRWAMKSWPRMHRFNQLAGTFAAALQMDYLPGLFCSAHFSVRRRPGLAPGRQVEQLLEEGARLQRFWLTATRLGLVMQPSLAPLALAFLGGSGETFTSHRRMQAAAAQLARRCARLLPGEGTDRVFLGRIGRPRKRQMPCRSTRLRFDELIEQEPVPPGGTE